MAKFHVQKAGPLMDETVEADRMHVTATGALVLYRSTGPDVGLPRRTETVHAFAPGRWVEVLRSDD